MSELRNILRWYEIIGVPYFSDYETVKSVFRKKIKQLHPDVKKTKDDAEVKEIIAAYKSLQMLYKDKSLLEYYKSEFINSNRRRNSKDLNLKEVFSMILSSYRLVFKGIAFASVVVLSILLFDNVVNILLFILVLVGGYLAFTRL